MSKSDASVNSRILITDSPEVIVKKINRAQTDSVDAISYDPANRPGVANLIDILSCLDPHGRTPEMLADAMAGHRIAELKEVVAQLVCRELAEVRERYASLVVRHGYLDHVATLGRIQAAKRAEETMRLVKAAVGLKSL